MDQLKFNFSLGESSHFPQQEVFGFSVVMGNQ